MINADAYTICSNLFAGKEARDHSVYYLANRYSPADVWGFANDSRMVLWGVKHALMNYFMKTPLDYIYDRIFDEFMDQAHPFGSLDYDRDIWLKIRKLGYLPIKIEGLPEGSTFYPNEPVIQVRSTQKGFGEIAAHIEACLVGTVGCGTARATLTRHLLERMREVCREEDEHEQTAHSLLHDFGMRASSNLQESLLFGMAHLLSFNGTDTFNAAFEAWYDCGESYGKSIFAQAHRTVLGHASEWESVDAIYNAVKDDEFPIVSLVADTYDTQNFINQCAVPIAKRFEEQGKGVVVVRPDSGDYINNIRMVVGAAESNNLFSYRNGKIVPTHMKMLLGDSMNWEKIQHTWICLDQLYCNKARWAVFGIGGWLRNQSTRDALSTSYKLSAKGDKKPVVKLSETPTKMSVPGPVRVVRDVPFGRPTVYLESETSLKSSYVTYYEDGKFMDWDNFRVVRDRAVSGFDKSINFRDFGLNQTCLSSGIREIQKKVNDI